MKRIKVWAIVSEDHSTVATSSKVYLVFATKKAADYGLSQVTMAPLPLKVAPATLTVESPKRRR